MLKGTATRDSVNPLTTSRDNCCQLIAKNIRKGSFLAPHFFPCTRTLIREYCIYDTQPIRTYAILQHKNRCTGSSGMVTSHYSTVFDSLQGCGGSLVAHLTVILQTRVRIRHPPTCRSMSVPSWAANRDRIATAGWPLRGGRGTKKHKKYQKNIKEKKIHLSSV